MKKLILIIACLYVGVAWGQKNVADLEYRIDTFHYKNESVFMQRYEDRTLMTVLGNNSHENRVALALRKLQEQLSSMNSYVVQQRDINFIQMGEKYIDEIKNENTGFDLTNYQNELNFYIRYNKELKDKSPEEGVRQQKVGQIVYLDSVSKEDPNVITEYDRYQAGLFEGSVDSRKYQGDAYKAEMKVKSIEATEKRRVQDSLYKIKQNEYEIAEKKEQAQKLKELTKKYGSVIAKKLLAEKVWIGMADKMVIDEYGNADVKRAITASGVTETWTYTPSSFCIGSGCPILDYYMVFKNHKLIAVGDL